MAIHITNEQELFPLDEEEIRQRMELVLSEEKCTSDLSIAIVDDERMSELHQQFLGIEGPTDVLSFPLSEDDENENDNLIGEIVVSAETALMQAVERSADPEAELMLYMIHGFLHLVGYDDKVEGKAWKMHSREDELLSFLGYT